MAEWKHSKDCSMASDVISSESGDGSAEAVGKTKKEAAGTDARQEELFQTLFYDEAGTLTIVAGDEDKELPNLEYKQLLEDGKAASATPTVIMRLSPTSEERIGSGAFGSVYRYAVSGGSQEEEEEPLFHVAVKMLKLASSSDGTRADMEFRLAKQFRMNNFFREHPAYCPIREVDLGYKETDYSMATDKYTKKGKHNSKAEDKVTKKELHNKRGEIIVMELMTENLERMLRPSFKSDPTYKYILKHCAVESDVDLSPQLYSIQEAEESRSPLSPLPFAVIQPNDAATSTLLVPPPKDDAPPPLKVGPINSPTEVFSPPYLRLPPPLSLRSPQIPKIERAKFVQLLDDAAEQPLTPAIKKKMQELQSVRGWIESLMGDDDDHVSVQKLEIIFRMLHLKNVAESYLRSTRETRGIKVVEVTINPDIAGEDDFHVLFRDVPVAFLSMTNMLAQEMSDFFKGTVDNGLDPFVYTDLKNANVLVAMNAKGGVDNIALGDYGGGMRPHGGTYVSTYPGPPAATRKTTSSLFPPHRSSFVDDNENAFRCMSWQLGLLLFNAIQSLWDGGDKRMVQPVDVNQLVHDSTLNQKRNGRSRKHFMSRLVMNVRSTLGHFLLGPVVEGHTSLGGLGTLSAGRSKKVDPPLWPPSQDLGPPNSNRNAPQLPSGETSSWSDDEESKLATAGGGRHLRRSRKLMPKKDVVKGIDDDGGTPPPFAFPSPTEQGKADPHDLPSTRLSFYGEQHLSHELMSPPPSFPTFTSMFDDDGDDSPPFWVPSSTTTQIQMGGLEDQDIVSLLSEEPSGWTTLFEDSHDDGGLKTRSVFEMISVPMCPQTGENGSGH